MSRRAGDWNREPDLRDPHEPIRSTTRRIRSALIESRGASVKTWKIDELETEPRKPEILDSTADARAIVIELPAGESLPDHQVHERAWLVLVAGEIVVTALEGSRATVEGGPGLLVEFDPSERHRVDARADSRFLLLLTPWPGRGHPGTLTIEEKAHVRERAAEIADGAED